MQNPDAIIPAAGSPAFPSAETLLALGVSAHTFSEEDSRAVARLPQRAREDFLKWYKLLEPLTPSVGNQRIKGIQTALEAVALNTGLPLVTIRRHYDRLRKGGWRGLVNRRLAGPAWWDRNITAARSIADRPAFLDFWQSLMQQYQGRDQTGSAAHNALIRRFVAWERGDPEASIPGYDFPPERDACTNLPAGWSYENLMRSGHQLPKGEAAAAKYGRGALANFRLPVLSTREGLKVGQIYVFDDQELDVRVNYLGVARQSFRPLCFDVQDYASAAQPLHGFKPVLVDEQTGKERHLTKRDFRWFVVALLTTVGYRRDTGTTLVVERGTAAIEQKFEDRIHLATGGRVTVDRGGIAGQPAYPGMFEGQARGNFRFKATLESARVALRNHMAALPGAVGKDRDHCPEDDFGRDRYNQKLLDAAVSLPAELVARLQFPILDWREFVSIALEIHRLIDGRTEHGLEGWERCRNFKYEYRLSTQEKLWLDAAEHFARMDESQRLAVHAHVQSKPGLWRTRKLSPQEVWEAGKRELVTVSDHALPMLMEAEDARRGERCEKNKLFIIQDKTLDAEPLHFDASALVSQGCVQPGEYYTVYLNPFAPARLVVCDSQLRYLGSAHFWDRVGRLDREEAAKRIAHARRDEAPSLANLARRGAQQTRRMITMHESNAATLAGRAPISVETAILQAADDAAVQPFLLPPHRPPPEHERPKKEEAEGSDLDLL